MNTLLRRAGMLARREPIGSLGLIVLLFWSVIAIGAIGSGAGWLGVARYDRSTVFQELNPDFVYYRVSLALDGVPSDLPRRDLSELLGDPEVYGGFADAADAQDLIQDFIQPLVSDEALIPHLTAGRQPWVEVVDGVYREADTGLIRDNNRPLMPAALKPPSWSHWFGTDRAGHDVYAAVADSAWQGWLIGFLAALIGVAGGVVVASVGMFTASTRAGPAARSVIKSLLDGLAALPPLVLLLLVLLGNAVSTWALILPLAAIALPLVWGELVEEDSSIVLNRSRKWSARTLAPSLIRVFRDVMILALLFEAALSFLGLGQSPGSWGFLIAVGRGWIISAPWMALLSGLALTSLLLATYAFGSGLRNLLAPMGTNDRANESPIDDPESSDARVERLDNLDLV